MAAPRALRVGFVVDPDGVVLHEKTEFEAIRYGTVDAAVAAAEDWLGTAFTR